MGRPPISEPRNRQFNLSLTESELASIQRRARALGMRPVHLGRKLLLDEQPKVIVHAGKVPDNRSRLIYDQLIRLGNNLNQLVRHIHRTGDPLPADLEPLLKDIRAIIARSCADDR